METGRAICALTKESGKFVDCHIIPRALTYSNSGSSLRGEAQFIEISVEGTRPKKAHSSWYDRQLVVEAGEAILSKIDDAGIAVLRKHELLGTKKRLMGERSVFLKRDEARDLRQLFHSILWRASETGLVQFCEIKDLVPMKELLRKSLLGEKILPPDSFITTLTQFHSLTENFNTAPYVEDLHLRKSSWRVAVFYMSGMSVCIHPAHTNPLLLQELGGRAIGYQPCLVVGTEDFKLLAQQLAKQKSLAESQYPKEIGKLKLPPVQ